MARKQSTVNKGPSDLTVLMNWVRDGNLNSKFPETLEKSYMLNAAFFLFYFLQNPNYFIFINNVFNNWDTFKVNKKDLYKMFKEIIYNTGYNPYNKGSIQVKENPLIKKLKLKFPYYKKEEIMMAVNIIDNSEDKDVIYEMFEINDVAKVKKMTKKDISERQNKIKNIISSDELLSIM